MSDETAQAEAPGGNRPPAERSGRRSRLNRSVGTERTSEGGRARSRRPALSPRIGPHGRHLVRILGDVDLAEEAIQDAYAIALERWPRTGLPVRSGGLDLSDSPQPRARHHPPTRHVRREAAPAGTGAAAGRTRRPTIRGRRSRRTRRSRRHRGRRGRARQLRARRPLAADLPACHPALGAEAQFALTLRLLGGLTTARGGARLPVRERRSPSAWCAPSARSARGDSLSRARQTIIARPARGRAGHALPDLQRRLRRHRRRFTGARGLCGEAIRLARLTARLMPDEPEAAGLLALMLLQDSRREARTDAPASSSRSKTRTARLGRRRDRQRGWRWQSVRCVRDGRVRTRCRRRSRPFTPGARARRTNWVTIVALYDALYRVHPTPVVALNRAVAVAMADGPAARPGLIDALAAERRAGRTTTCSMPPGPTFCAAWAVRAGKPDYETALGLATNPVERAFLARRIAECGAALSAAPQTTAARE